MAQERNFQYSQNRVSFRLYENDRLAAADSLQRELAGRPEADHGLRFTKFFGRWAADPRRKPEDKDLVLLKEIKQDWEAQRRSDQWESKSRWETTDPVLDWLDPSPACLKTANGTSASLSGLRPKGKVTPLPTGDAGGLERASARLEALAKVRMKAKFGTDARTDDATFELSLVSRLLTGIGLPHPTENGFLFHPTLAVPYLRGTALKQVARDRAEEKGIDENRLDRLFGNVEERPAVDGAVERQRGAGCLAFLDALPTGQVMLTAEQITNHYKGYYGGPNPALGQARGDMEQPADWHEPNPVTLLAIDASFDKPLVFRFAILPLRNATPDDVADGARWLREGLEEKGVGARTTLGFGRFENDTAKQGRERWVRNEEERLRQDQPLSAPAEAGRAPPVGGGRTGLTEEELARRREALRVARQADSNGGK